MPKLAIIGTLEVAPGRKVEVLPLLMAHRARCLKDEPGTLQFEVLVPREDIQKCFCTKSIETTLHSTCIGTELPLLA